MKGIGHNLSWSWNWSWNKLELEFELGLDKGYGRIRPGKGW